MSSVHFVSAMRSSGWESTGHGYVAIRTDEQSVRVVHCATGEVWWERTFPRNAIAWTGEAERYVLLMLDGRDLWVCDAMTGARLAVLAGGEGGAAPALSVGRVAWRPVCVTRHGILEESQSGSGKRSVALRKLPSGDLAWRAELPEGRIAVAPEADTICVAGSDSLQVRDLATGEIKAVHGTGAMRGYLVDARLDPVSRVFYMLSFDGGGEGGPKATLASVDLASGRKRDVVSIAMTSYPQLLLDAAVRGGDLLPCLVREMVKSPDGRSTTSTNLSTVSFVRKSDGTVAAGLGLPSARSDGKFENLRSLFLQDGTLVLLVQDGVQVFSRSVE